MPVMETIRRGTDSTAMRVVFAAIVLVFVFWGIGGTGARNTLIAEVNGVRITDTRLQKEMRRASRTGGSSMDDDARTDLARQIISALISEELMLQEADHAGLDVSGEEVARALLEFEAFQDEGGNFSTSLYERTLKRNGSTPGQFETELRRDLLLRKLSSTVAAAVHVSDSAVRRQFELENTQVSVRWLEIPDEALVAGIEVAQADIDAFVAGELEQLRTAYEADFERLYSEPQKATLSTILLRTDLEDGQGRADVAEVRRRMEAIAAEVAAGGDFAELARRHSEDFSATLGGDLFTLAETQMDPVIARAVFSTDVGSVTEIVSTSRGLQILSVRERQDAKITPLDAVQDDIARELLARERLGSFSSDLSGQILEGWKTDGSAPADLLSAHGLKVDSGAAFAQGRPVIGRLELPPQLIADLASTDGQGLLEQVYRTTTGHLLVEITAVNEPEMALFEVQKDYMRAMLQSSRERDFIQRWQKDIRARARVTQHYFP